MTEPIRYDVGPDAASLASYGFVGISVAIMLPFMISRAFESGDAVDFAFPGLMLALLGALVLLGLKLSREIVLHPNGRLEFRSPGSVRFVDASELIAIEPSPRFGGLFQFRHTHGRELVRVPFQGFHDLATRIKTLNPGINVVGC